MTNTNVQQKEEWILLDATDAKIGRLATEVATKLMEKDSVTFVPNRDLLGRHIVVININNLDISQKKREEKLYYRHSWYRGGLKTFTMNQMLEKDSEFVFREAVRRMLPDNKMRKDRLKRLHIYTTDTHPHSQVKTEKK